MRPARAFGLLLAAWLLACATASADPGGAIVLPQDRPGRFLGVETCGTKLCHDSAEPWRNATVSMQERRIWQAHDTHAGAQASLASELAARISANLGLADATSARPCLVCHSTDVALSQRGPKLRGDEGVSCESCHGAGGDFLRAHLSPTATYASNVAAGLYPTADSEARATLCLSCHRGDARRRITHRFYAAGHPRLRFELDTYGARQPYHHRVDADYRRRKPAPSHFRLWAAGAIGAAQALIKDVYSTPRAATGVFPEPSLYDCHACHSSYSDGLDFASRVGLPPGVPVLADAPLLVLRAVAAVIEPQLVSELRDRTRALERSPRDGPARVAALQGVGATLRRLQGTLTTYAEQPTDASTAAAALVVVVAEEQPLPYVAAESIAMGLSTLLLADYEERRLDPEIHARVEQAVDRLYATLEDEGAWRPAAFAQAAGALRTVRPRPAPPP